MRPEEAAALFIAYGKVTGPASQLLNKTGPKPKLHQVLKAREHAAAAGVQYEMLRDATITILRWHGIPIPDNI